MALTFFKTTLSSRIVRFARKPLVLCVVCLLCLGSSFSLYADESIYIIANKSVPVTSIDTLQLRRVFSKRQGTWQDGTLISVMIFQPALSVHKSFCKDTLRMFPYQIEKLWDKLVYSGIGEKPIEVSSSQEMIERVSNQAGAIGYIKASNPSDLMLDANVKLIELEE